ncbi:3-dehydroquinate synthase [uncultured Nevskia sp.]|uniref:3-dehydroquinate synthase n=1 Tax=uncultured Nevskia sp. TaxID=228950 RepID=UPI0025D0FF32|nr:3-dehydroquinate synthase [uncultured Nevskia sp.]
MRRLLSVELGERSYPLAIGAGLLADPESYAELRGKTLRIVTDANVAARYLDPVLDALNLTREHAFVLPAGELQKTWANAEQVLDWLLASRIARDGVLIALGGGVIGDLTGFVASIYQRGIAFVQMPTTLLSQVDSSVGGKTGVNHARGKNLIGAFHQPIAVFADTDTLNTLPPRELSAGLAEVIKCGMLGDAALFARLERDLDAILGLDPNAVAEAVERCCKLKARIVALDERESLAGGPRTLLNLGHTFGHAVETFTRYETWLHGEAVGLGLAMAADMSMRLGWLKPEDAERCLKLIERAKLPVRPPAAMTPDDFRSLMARDKKVAAGKLRLVLMRAIGEAATTADFDVAALDATLDHFCTPSDAAGTATQAA